MKPLLSSIADGLSVGDVAQGPGMERFDHAEAAMDATKHPVLSTRSSCFCMYLMRFGFS